MKFCALCDNMYYLTLNPRELNTIRYYCRKCNHEELHVDGSRAGVLQVQARNDDFAIQHLVNPFTRLDPTLPRVNNIPCPSAACASNASSDAAPREVIYLRFDDGNMKYVYLCTVCEHVWKMDNNDH